MGDFLLEGIELGLAAVAIAEQSYTDALPIARMHGERRTCGLVMQSIGTVIELVAVGLTVITNAEP